MNKEKLLAVRHKAFICARRLSVKTRNTSFKTILASLFDGENSDALIIVSHTTG